MQTKIFKIDPQKPDIAQIRGAADILRRGGLLAFPTETVYGLGADATSPDASARIYKAKGRPSDNPLIVHIAKTSDLSTITNQDLTIAHKLADRFWPGPLTMVLKKSAIIPDQTTGGLDTVAVRLPGFEISRLIIDESGLPIAAPSANISGRPSPTEAGHVINDLEGIVDGIVDAGTSVIGLESTIVDLSADHPVVLRRGFITGEELGECLGIEVLEPDDTDKSQRPKAPGMKYKHYAPQAALTIVEGETKSVISYISDRVQTEGDKGETCGILCAQESADNYPADLVYILGSRAREEDIMHNLYRILRDLDAKGVTVAFCEDFSELHHGELIMERLHKASGGRIVSL